MKNVLLIDDNDDFRETAREILSGAGYEVWDAPSPHDAFPILQREQFDVILCDLHMPFTTDDQAAHYVTSCEVGIKTVHELAWVYPATPIVALSSTPRSSLRRIAKYLDPIPTFPKPYHPQDLLNLVDELAKLESSGQIQ